MTSSHPLTNFEVQKYYQNKSKFDDVYSRSNLRKIKNWTYVINLGKFESLGTHRIALYVSPENVRYFDNFGLEHISKKFKR